MIDWDAIAEAQDTITEEVGLPTSIARGVDVLWSGPARWDPRRPQAGFDAPQASTDLQSFWVVTVPSSIGIVPALGDKVSSERRDTRIVRIFDKAGENWTVPEFLVSAEEVSRSATMIVLSRRDISGVISQLPAQGFVVALQATRPVTEVGSNSIDTAVSGERATVPGTMRSVGPTADIRVGDRFPFEGKWARVDLVRQTSDGSAIEANITLNYGSV